VASEYQPGNLRMLCLSGHDARDGSEVFTRVHDLIKARADGIAGLIGAHRDEYTLRVWLEQGYGPLELCATVVRQRCLIALHASAAAPGQYQGVDRRRNGHRR